MDWAEDGEHCKRAAFLAMKWYYRRSGQEVGPLETADLKKLVNRGELGPSDLVWHTEAQGWMRVAEARKLLIGSGSSPNKPATADSGKANPSDTKSTQEAEAVASPDEAETEDNKNDTVTDQPKKADDESQQPDPAEKQAQIAELSAHRPDTRSSANEEGIRARGDRQTDVTAGIVDRLRRRMEEITGEELPAKAPPAPEEIEDPEPVEVADAVLSAEAAETPVADAQSEPRPPKLPAKEPSSETTETGSKSAKDKNSSDIEPTEKVAAAPKEPAVVVPPLPTKKAKPSPAKTPKPSPRAASKPVDTPDQGTGTQSADEKDASTSVTRVESEKPKGDEAAPNEAAISSAPAQGKNAEPDSDAASSKAEPEADTVAPSKQVAKPVPTNKLPPRELIADFRPPESAFDSDKKAATGRQDRPRSGKRLTTGKIRLRRGREKSEAEKPKSAPRSFLSRRSLRNSEPAVDDEQDTVEPAAAASPALGSPVPADNEPAAKKEEQRAQGLSQATPTVPDTVDNTSAEASDVSGTSDTSTEEIKSPRQSKRSDPDSPPSNRLSAEETEVPKRPRRRNASQSSDPEESAGGRRSRRGDNDRTTTRREPHDLAKAAAEALRRERSRAAGKTSNGAKNAKSDDRQQDETPASQPIPLQPSAPAGAQASASVDQLVQPGAAGPSTSESSPGRTGRADALPNNPPPGLRRQKGPGESSAVRSLPGRQAGSRKTGAKKSRRREGTNVVPPVRQALSARNESARTRHVQGRYSLARSYWINLVLVTGVLAGAGAAGVWYLASNARIYPLVGLAALLAVLILLIAPSQIRGVWRSANEHAKHKNGSIIARVAQASLALFVGFYGAAIAGLVVPAAAAAIILLKSEDEREFKVQVNRTGTIIQIDGQIDPGLTDHVDDTIRRSPRAHTVVLNSTGGYLFEARRLRDLIQASPIRATYTRTGCRGACILPFMATDERVAEVGSALQFGGPTGASGPLALVDERLGVGADRRYLQSRGVDPERFDLAGLSGVNSSDRHLDLLDADILTAVSVGNDVFRKDTVQDVSKAQVERALLTVPFFDTLARVEPDLFSAFRDGVSAASVDSVETDGLGDRTFDSASPLIEHVKATYLQTAPDRPTDDLMAALIALGDILQPINPGACVALVSPSDQTLGQSVASYLDVDRREAYFQAFDQIVVMSGRDPQSQSDPEATVAFSQPIIESVADGNPDVEMYLSDGSTGSLSTDEQCTAVLGYLKALRGEDLVERAAAFRQFVTRLN